MTGITISPLVPMPIIYLLGLIALALIAYGLWQNARGALLRAIPIAALLVAILDPELVQENQTPLKDVALVVVDDSESQNFGERQERTEAALQKLTTELAAVEDLEVRTIRAGRSNQSGGEDGTRLFGALGAAMGDVPQQRLAGVILITDGQVHDALDPARARQIQAPYMNAPVHALITGEHKEVDRRIRIENAPDFGLVGQSARVRLRVEDTTVPAGTPVAITIRRNGAQSQTLTIDTGTTADVPMPIDNAGTNAFEVDVPTMPNELSTANNRTLVSINGVRDRLRVLLVSGQPHQGERAWRNLLKSDPNVDLVHFTVLRPLTKEDNTPLEELALIPFPTRELFEERLSEFDLVIFDRYGQRNLVPAQYMARLVAYVEQGGAVMLAVGPEYADTYSLFGGAFQSILPAEPTGRVFSGAFRPQLSETGLRHPVTSALSGAPTDLVTQPNWGRWLRQIQVIPSRGHQVMTGQEGEPLLILQRVKEGRVALLLSDTIWLWGKGFDGGGPQEELMRRLAHWLMKEPELEEEALTAEARGGALVVTRHSLSEEEVPVTVTPPTGAERSVTPTEIGGGRFVAQLPITDPGLYRLADGTNTAVVAVGSPNPLEAYDVVATADRLEPLAKETGGGVYWLEDGAAPSIRRVSPGRASHGTTWIGLVANKQFIVTGVNQTPLAPIALILLAVMAGAMVAWWREGR